MKKKLYIHNGRNLNAWPKINYAWLVMVACTLVMFYSIGLAINMLSIFLVPVISSLSLTKTQGASIMSVETLMAAVAIIISGSAYKKFSIRWFNLFCAVLMATGFTLLAFASSLGMCYVAAGIIGFGQGAGSIIPVSSLLTNWFQTSRGLALGIAATGSGFANMIYAPLINWVIQNYGLANAFLFQSGSIIILAIAATLLIRDHPACKGCLPYGSAGVDSSVATKKDIAGCIEGDERCEYSLRALLHSKDYWTLSFIVFIIGVALVPINNHIPAFLISQGYSTAFAAYIFSLFGFAMIIGKIIYGRIIDKFGSYIANTYIYTVLIGALLSTFLVGKWDFAPYLFGLLLGLGNPIGTMTLPIWTSDFFGIKNYTQIFTNIKIFMTLGISVGMLAVGFLADLTGTYRSSFALFAVLLLVGYQLIQASYVKHLKMLKETTD